MGKVLVLHVAVSNINHSTLYGSMSPTRNDLKMHIFLKLGLFIGGYTQWCSRVTSDSELRNQFCWGPYGYLENETHVNQVQRKLTSYTNSSPFCVLYQEGKKNLRIKFSEFLFFSSLLWL